MYPEEGGGGAAAPAEYYPGDSGIKSKLAYHLEGLIPIILILIIAFFVVMKFGIINSSTPVIGAIVELFEGPGPANMLIIGNSSVEVIEVLNRHPQLVNYRLKTAESLARNPTDQLRNYDLVMLDQSEETNKEVSMELGRAIEEFVKRGGSLIVVKDSGIRRPNAYDILGWESNFRGIVPVTCERKGQMDLPSCINPIIVRGKLHREDFDHKIMQGIDVFPAEPGLYANFTTFDVTPTGNEIAYLEDAVSKKTYAAIVEKRLIMGKSIYFNYNPGKTEGIFTTTLEYLR